MQKGNSKKMPKQNNPKEMIEGEVIEVFALEKTLAETEQALMQDEKFKNFLTMQKDYQAKIAEFWKTIESQMLEHDIKSIKGDWGSLTIAERLGWKTDLELLPKKFIKKVVDTKKLSDTFRLEGKAPKGAEPTYTKYLTKRIK